MSTLVSRSLSCAVLFVFACSITELARAHEFWIEPEAALLKPAQRLVANLKVGLNFRGDAFPYLRNKFVKFSLLNREKRFAVIGEDGDVPAISLPTAPSGLNVIVYFSTPDRLTHNEWNTFVSYADEEGLKDLVRLHTERGLPKIGFVELYTRCAKALVQSGEIATDDGDKLSGMPLELVAQTNPYNSNDAVVVKLLWRGVPKSDTQVTVFRDDGRVAKAKLRTDEQGNVTIPLSSGGHFMLSSVQIEPTTEDGAVWQSYWASLTFEMPTKIK